MEIPRFSVLAAWVAWSLVLGRLLYHDDRTRTRRVGWHLLITAGPYGDKNLSGQGSEDREASLPATMPCIAMNHDGTMTRV